MIYLFSFLSIAFAGTDYFPNFYGEYAITNWTCESTLKDSGCADSARIVIEASNNISTISVFNANGVRIRWNELIEKGDAKSSAVLRGDENSAAYIVEAKDSAGKRYFYNLLEIRRLENGRLQFTHLNEASAAGLNNSIKRIFTLEN